MHSFKSLAWACALSSTLSLAPIAAHAAQGDLQNQLAAARQEGSIWTAFALNKHLSPFQLSVTVSNGVALLQGKVETGVDRELAEQIALDTRGIESVDNRLEIDEALAEHPSAPQKIAQQLDDATLTATIKSKLLWNNLTQGLDISVQTVAGVVTLKGHAPTADAKQLAGDLATRTGGVYEVNNLISLSAADTRTTGAVAAQKKTEATLSDAWITGKVKSSLLFNRNLDGVNIDVDTKSGMVSLKGEVASAEEKTMAVEVARNIRGVRGVDADLLKVTKVNL